MEENTAFDYHETARNIRRKFRTLMSGPTSESMRDKGLDYHVNWGISLPHLQELSKEFTQDIHVAMELWKDNVRESKIMALMLMPKEDFTSDIALLWSESLLTQEIAEMASMILYQYTDFASQMSYAMLASGTKLQQILAYNTFARLFSQGMYPDERGVNELLDQATPVLLGNDLQLKHAVMNCINRLGTTADGLYATVVEKFLMLNV